MRHPLKASPPAKPARAGKRAGMATPTWPSYQDVSQLVGTSPSGRVTVYVDPSLGAPGLQNAQDLVNDADRVATDNDTLFSSAGGPVSVIVFALDGRTDGTGGADHMGCDYQTGAAIEVCASFGNSARVSALAQDGMLDYVNQTKDTDQDDDSTGCGMAFISWLISQGYGLDGIAQAMVSLGDNGTLADLYADLTSDAAANAWPSFQAAVQNLTNGVTSDDPFGAVAQATSQLHLSPSTAALAGRLFASILADLSATRPAQEVLGNARAALCTSRSRRLRPSSMARQ